MARIAMCDYTGAAKPCGNRAAWKVSYLTPDDGKNMRVHVYVLRCYWHAEHEKFFPKGTSQITIRGEAPHGQLALREKANVQ